MTESAIEVSPGTRIVVVGDLHLGPRPTDVSLAVAAELATALETWVGPGVLVLNGGTFDAGEDAGRAIPRILDVHPRLALSLERWAACEGRTVALVDPSCTIELKKLRWTVVPRARLDVETGAGLRAVYVEDGAAYTDAPVDTEDDDVLVASHRAYVRTSRLLTWLVAPFAAALVLLLGFLVVDALRPSWARDLLTLSERVAIAGTALVLALVIVAVLVKTTRSFRATGEPRSLAITNDEARRAAEALVADGAAGLITGHSHRPELSALGPGFYANHGNGGVIVIRRDARFGFPPVYVAERQLSWVELEAGADLHVRLLHSHVELPGLGALERAVVRPGPDPLPKPAVVATFPGGTDWPAPVDSEAARRRVRRQAGAVLALAGLVNLVSAVTPPLRQRFDVLRDLVPVAVPQTASALVAAASIALLLLSRGVRRGQRHAWMLAVAITAATAALDIVKGLDLEESVVALAALAFLLAKRNAFAAGADRTSISRALATLAFGGATAIVLGMISALWLPTHNHGLSVWQAFVGVTERLVGIDTQRIPGRRDHFLVPALGGVGLGLAATTAWLIFRPVVEGRGMRSDSARARAIVRRHGGDTLAYFALRDDKLHWFWEHTLVAYAVHNGVCLVSPDPIGPASERATAWRAFRRFADDHGWTVAVMGAGEAWLPIYRGTGMRDIYIGDEAIVDAQRFTLEGGRMKGLRQAVNRIDKYGYRIEFHDPAHLPPGLEPELRGLMGESRRGEVERGFSMTLGRVFAPDDEGLLLAVCFAPSGEVAAFCQYVPAADIDGYSLDLMRRSESDDHPNGLTDFVVVRTIEHLRERGMRGLGLNFAVMRSVLAHETGDRIGLRIERRMLGWLSDSMQIESLWKYNAKFDPDWHPRYAVYDAPENFLTSAIAVAKAESFWELPLIGRFFAPDEQPSASQQ